MAYANNDNKGAEQLEDMGGHSGKAGQQGWERATLRTMIVSNLAKLEQAWGTWPIIILAIGMLPSIPSIKQQHPVARSVPVRGRWQWGGCRGIGGGSEVNRAWLGSVADDSNLYDLSFHP